MPRRSQDDALLSERCRHTTAIVLLNGLVIFECVFMLARATNPFFGAMDKPTPAFIAFMLAQIALLGAAVLLTVGTCACKEKLVAGNRALFFAVALANVVYGTVFFVRKDYEGGVTFFFGALLAVFGAMLCARFLLTLTLSHERLPTQSPAFTPHKDIRVK